MNRMLIHLKWGVRYPMREPKKCLSRVLNSKFGSLALLHGKFMAYIQPLLELKTQSKLSPVSSSTFSLVNESETKRKFKYVIHI